MLEPTSVKAFQPSAGVPNSGLPLVLWKGRAPRSQDGGRDICRLYERNGWQGTWVYHVFPYWHFHTLGHEVLTGVAGSARIGFGGEGGIEVDVEPGDVVIIPAGVGHKRLTSSEGFLVAGGYPPGQSGNIVRPGDIDEAVLRRAIEAVALPETDPISGKADGVVAAWREVAY